MATGYRNDDLVKNTTDGVSCSASATTAVTNNFRASAEDSRNIKIALEFSDIRETTGITVALQDSHDGGTTWNNVKSATAVTKVANVETVTFDTKANSTAGDHIVLYDSQDRAWGISLDITGVDPEPTASTWTAIAAGRKTHVDISTLAATCAGRDRHRCPYRVYVCHHVRRQCR